MRFLGDSRGGEITTKALRQFANRDLLRFSGCSEVLWVF